jgi:SAM-dependent methyltransferase
VPDAAYDVVVCGLALSHVPALRPVIAEFVRVLRPGGHLVISDVHVQRILLGSRMIVSGPDGQLGLMPTSHFLASDYLDAALPLGLQVRRCVEPRQPAPVFGPHERPPVRPDPTKPSHSCWDLHEWCPDAVRAAFTGTPVAIIWHFQRAEDR